MEKITYLGITNFRNKFEHFGIKTDDRRRHMYLIGKTGVGKTTLLENMIVQDIKNGKGVGVIDPHGELVLRILHFIPKERVEDVFYFNPSDINWPIAFNVIEEVPKEWRHLVVAGLMGVFKKIWPDVWSARMEYILNNSLLALLEYPNSTLLGVNRLLSDADFRNEVLKKITDPVVKVFWEKEFSSYNQRYASEAVAPIQNKIGQFISNPLIRNIIGQRESKIDFREIMDNKKIFLANLSKGLIGEDNSNLLGALIITKMQLAAMSRVELPEEERSDFYLYVDEFQNFSTESFANIFAEARKYRLNLILAHQYINQLNEKVRDAIFGNIGTLICYRVGPEDAELLEKYFMPEFTKEDLINLSNYHFYIKLMIDGTLSKGFSAINIPPQNLPATSYLDSIIEHSRKLYSRDAKEVEREIAYWEMLDFKPEEEYLKKSPYLKKPQEGWEAVCSNCGKKIIVPFRPFPSRPVYCKECLEKMRQEKEGKISLKELSKKEIIKAPPKSVFFKEKERKELPEENKNKISKILKNIFGQ